MDENNITNDSTNQNTENPSSNTPTAVEETGTENKTTTENTADTTNDNVTKTEDTSSQNTPVFDSQPVSDTYEQASTAATTPVKSAFEMNNTSSSASTSVNYYSAPDSTSAANNTTPNTTSAPVVNSTTPNTASTPAVNNTAPNTSSAPAAGYNSDFYTGTASQEPAEMSTGFGIASLVFGIISILPCCCGVGSIFSILGIIFGCIQEKDSYGKKPGQAVAGIILSRISLVLSIIGIIFAVFTGMLSEL